MSATKFTALALVAAMATPIPTAAQTGRGNPLSSIFRCEADGNRQTTATVIGGVVGGAVGNQLSKKDRALGTVLGAALGAAAGSYVGCRMQTSDQQKAQQAAEDALNRGGAQRWSNPETGASGNVQVVSGQPVNLAGLRLASGVTLANGYEGVGGRYQARDIANLRGGPSTTSAIVGKLKKGEAVDAIARVSGTNWLLVGNSSVGRGYVSETVVAAMGGATHAQASGPICKTFDQTLNTLDGVPETRRYTACQDATGQWVVQS